MTSFLSILPALALVAIATPAAAAPQRATEVRRADNARQTAELGIRLDQMEDRLTSAVRSRAITRARAARLRRQVARTRQEMTALSRRQGFVSAAQIASYNRTLGAIDVELDRRGVARSYGNDALPSAEMIAFGQVDARLHYRDARIEYDADECAVYQGRARDGQIRRERLLSPAGRPFCARR